ncbi:MAG TPA: glycosyltransferase [Jiangellaceae bacterium]|nr:glycosyltransferase [Jiangellaceae bacterium]
MRIAMVSEHASPLAVLGGADAGGQNVYVGALATALAARGHQVDVYTRRDAFDLPPEKELCPGVTVVHVTAGPPRRVPKDELLPHMPTFSRRLARSWSDPGRRPDVVHAHFWMSGTAAVPAARDVGVPVVQTFHALGAVKRRYQGSADTSPPERIQLETALCSWADTVLATCTDEVAELVRVGAARERVQVVPCGVDTGWFTPDGDAWPRGVRRRLLSLGRLVERKGVDTIIRALPHLPEAELLIAGGPPAADLPSDAETRRLAALATELGVADQVRLLGCVAHESVPALIRSADVVVTTPWYEPFGIVPLEAMSCARPVVGSAVGGLLDTVVDGVTGLLVPPRDPYAVTAAVQSLLANERRRAGFGRAARRRAVAEYDWARVADRVDQVYRSVAVSGAPSVEAVS